MSQKYFDQLADIARRARAVRELVTKPEQPFFEGVKGIDNVVNVWREALIDFRNQHGQLPPDGVLANAHAALQRQIDPSNVMLESAPHRMSHGILKTSVWSMFILPAMIQSTTSSLCTFINASHSINDVLKLFPRFADKLGDYDHDNAEGTQAGRYSGMRRYMTPTAGDVPDGTKTTFTFWVDETKSTMPDGMGKAMIRPGSVTLVWDGKTFPLDIDNESINHMTMLRIPGLGTTEVYTEYFEGKIQIAFDKSYAAKLKAGTRLIVECELDNEFSPFFTPKVIVQQQRHRVRTSPYYLATEFTMQSMQDLMREQGLGMSSFIVTQMTAMIAKEQDSRRLHTALAAVSNTETINAVFNAKTDDVETWIFGIKKEILRLSDEMQARTKSVGITGAYCGEEAARLFRNLPVDYFTPDPAFPRMTGIRRAGMLFGLIDIYQVDNIAVDQLAKVFPEFKTNSALFFGSDGMGHSPLLAGDGIAPTEIDHATTPGLMNQITIFGTEVNEINPFDGTDYLVLVELKTK